MSVSYLDILLNRDINGKLTTPVYDKRDDFNLSIVFFCIYVAIYHHHLHIVCMSQKLIRYARAFSAYDQFLSRGKLLTNKLFVKPFLYTDFVYGLLRLLLAHSR